MMFVFRSNDWSQLRSVHVPKFYDYACQVNVVDDVCCSTYDIVVVFGAVRTAIEHSQLCYWHSAVWRPDMFTSRFVVRAITGWLLPALSSCTSAAILWRVAEPSHYCSGNTKPVGRRNEQCSWKNRITSDSRSRTTNCWMIRSHASIAYIACVY